MIVDSSALVAILTAEPDAAELAAAIQAHPCRISTATALETALVMQPAMAEEVDELLDAARAELIPFDAAQLRHARDAMSRYGRGSGSPARLNFGDCFSYALAKVTGEPLLFKGDDFRHTDVTPAL